MHPFPSLIRSWQPLFFPAPTVSPLTMHVFQGNDPYGLTLMDGSKLLASTRPAGSFGNPASCIAERKSSSGLLLWPGRGSAACASVLPRGLWRAETSKGKDLIGHQMQDMCCTRARAVCMLPLAQKQTGIVHTCTDLLGAPGKLSCSSDASTTFWKPVYVCMQTERSAQARRGGWVKDRPAAFQVWLGPRFLPPTASERA
jgi:hypothetical protein